MKIKNSLLDNATLAYYEVGIETEVIADASPVGHGAMLTQKKRPVMYISRSLSPLEQEVQADGTRSIGYSLGVRAAMYVLGWSTFQGGDRSQAFRSHIQQLKQ